MEFELDDYRTGKIKQKRRNLSCISEPGDYCNNNYNYNYNKKKSETSCAYNEKIKTENNVNNKNKDKPIYVNFNNNYLVTKLKKENENLRLKLSKYENNNTICKPIDNTIRQKKNENALRITKKILSNKPLITKSSNNFSICANNTYTNNFYNPKENKYATNINSSGYNDLNKNIYIYNTMSTNSFISQNKNNNKNGAIKSLSVLRNPSKNKSKIKNKKIIYDKKKSNYKRIENKLSSNSIINTENNNKKMKDKLEDNIINNINIKHLYNSRINTLNNEMHNNNIRNNIFSWKKKKEKSKKKVNFNILNGNICNTDRNQTDENFSNSNSKDRKNNIFNPNNEFNLTWSKFPKKSIETSFEHYYKGKKVNNEYIILSSKNVKMNNSKFNNNRNLNKITKNENVDLNEKKEEYNINIKRKEVTPQKITINRRRITHKVKTNKSNIANNNISMKNIIQIQRKNFNYDNNMNTIENNKNHNIYNNFHEGDIYVHKKRNSEFGIEAKNLGNNDYIELKKNGNINNKYNITINNINNCNYIRLIEAMNKSELKIIQKTNK